MKRLRFIETALVAMILCVSFIACSDDDEKNAESDSLKEIIIGTWAQDGDDDIFVLNANGTGIGYEDSDLFEQNEPCYAFFGRTKMNG